MNNDLSSVKVGDDIWTIYHGWTKVINIASDVIYPILTEGRYLYTLDGKHHINAKYPSAFIEPPAEFNAGPKPSRFKKGDRVLVCDHKHASWRRRYFSHEDGGIFYCFVAGDEWLSNGETTDWLYCKPWKEGEGE